MNIFEWLTGYCTVEIRSWYCERIITAVTRAGIAIWNIQRIDEKTMHIRIGLYEDKELISTVESEKEKLSPNTEIKILEKKGFIPWLFQHKMRSGFVAGAILCLTAIILMFSIIWSIDTKGLHAISPIDFSNALEKNGLYVGALSGGHDFDEIRLSLMREFSNIAYVTFNINGSRLEIDVEESTMPPETVDNLEYRNIVAKEDGVLILAEAYEGKINVKVGQAVEKGDLLVSGIFPSKEIGYRPVRASAKMLAYTKRTYESFTPYTVTEYVHTKESCNKYEISVFNIKIPLPFLGNHSYEFFDTNEETVHLTAGEDVLPVSIKVSNITKLEAKTHTLTKKEAEEKLLAEINERMRPDINGLEVTDKTVTFSETELGLYCRVDCTVIDDIAFPQPIYTEFIERLPTQKE